MTSKSKRTAALLTLAPLLATAFVGAPHRGAVSEPQMPGPFRNQGGFGVIERFLDVFDAQATKIRYRG